jgi:holo-[acyl-carrier protein] synthase
MNVIGSGVDIVKNERIRIAIKKKNFISRIFTVEEIKQSIKKKDKVSFYAKRFAAKEAFVKSIGTGFREKINFKDINIVNDKFGKPSIMINKRIKDFIKKRFNIKRFDFFLSISDEKKYSIAFVIFQK